LHLLAAVYRERAQISESLMAKTRDSLVPDDGELSESR
jgi:hypothetical protein